MWGPGNCFVKVTRGKDINCASVFEMWWTSSNLDAVWKEFSGGQSAQQKGCRREKARWEVWELSNFFPRNLWLSYIAWLSFISFQNWDVKCSHGRKDETQFLGTWHVVPWNFRVRKWRSWCLISPLPLHMFRSLKCFKLGSHLLAQASLKYRLASSHSNYSASANQIIGAWATMLYVFQNSSCMC